MLPVSFTSQGVGLSDVDLKGLFLKHADTLRRYLLRKVLGHVIERLREGDVTPSDE